MPDTNGVTGGRRVSLSRFATVGAVLVGVALLLAGVGAMGQSFKLARDSGLLLPASLLSLLPFAVWSYALRIARWHILVRRLVPSASLAQSAHSQIVGFTFAATPARVAEIYKVKVLAQSTGVPTVRLVPAAIAERLTDLLAFAGLALVGVFASGGAALGLSSSRAGIALVLAGVLSGLAVIFLARRPLRGALVAAGRSRFATRLLVSVGRLPGAQRVGALLVPLRDGGQAVTRPRTLIPATALTTVGRLGDAVVIWRICQIIGHPVSLTYAVAMIGIAGFLGGVTLSPGGIGAAEAAMIALVAAQGTPFGAALVVALGSRAFIFWLWVALGLVVFGITLGASRFGGGRQPRRWFGHPEPVVARARDRALRGP